ncbi:MAG: alpha-hydroxy-acid oxidizing protein [Atopobiaceae bacterium]|jgi:hypothetical protein|nr:alpha-hydroxy-acid oxidizing protein [Atopobiaceae bacterium]
MEYAEVLKAARGNVGPHCQACPVCDGRACGAHIPGPGSRDGIASRNHDAWGSILLNMDTISGASDPDTSVGLFGRRLSLPLMAAPIGAISNHFGPSMGDAEYAEALVSGCAEAGIVAFTGDGLGERMFRDGVDAIARAGGVGIPTIKPWAEDEVRSKMSDALSGGAMAVAMDIDAAGLPFLRTSDVASGPKTVAELSRFVGMAHGVPFVVKGVMCAAGAEKAIEAGASAIVVSNHGGTRPRVVPRDRRGPSRGRRRGRRARSRPRRRGHKERRRYLQGARARGERRARLPPVRGGRPWGGQGGHRLLCAQAELGALGDDADVRRRDGVRHHARHGQASLARRRRAEELLCPQSNS